MFTNKGRPTETNVPTLPDPLVQRRQSSGRSGIASIIANGVKITGTIDADGAEIKVDGEIEGNVRGGSLTVSWAPGEPIRMRGTATHVFTGEINLEAFA